MFWRYSGPKLSGSFIANYQYDDSGRRISKVAEVIAAQGKEEVVFPQDGWNVIQEWEAQAAINLFAVRQAKLGISCGVRVPVERGQRARDRGTGLLLCENL
jgi:hypothetical protein